MIQRHISRPLAVLMAAALALGLGVATASTASAYTYSCSPGQTLRYGQWNSNCVYGLQTYLNGYQDAGLARDGDFGWGTHHAVRAYQSAHNLTVDGIVGPQTRNYMCGAGTGIPTNSGASWAEIQRAGEAIHTMCLGWGYVFD